jgi:hypothetical protein
MVDLDLLRQVRRLGELEGAAFDAGLAARERAERGERLSRIALGGDEADLPVPAAGPPRRDLAELESRLRELSHFHDAVTRSLSWKVLQRLRGLFGRAW